MRLHGKSKAGRRVELRSGVALLFLAMSALAGCSWGAPSVPWEKLESVVEGFPVPEGFIAEKPIRNGRYCGKFEFECEKPRVSMIVTKTEALLSEEEGCELLDVTIDRWARSSLRDVEFQEDSGCTYFGKVGSYKVSAYPGEDEGEVRSFVIVVFG